MENKTNLECVKIYGLFGKKNVHLKFNEIAKILIAGNGEGKTTILNIIVGLLTQNFRTLTNINFQGISLKLKDEEEVYISKKDLLIEGRGNIFYSNLKEIVEEYEDYYGDEILNIYNGINLIKDNYKNELSTVIKELKKILPVRIRRVVVDMYEELDLTKDEEYNGDNKILPLLNKLDFEILYFTTYRRIEKENFSNLEIKSNNDGINFGMRDVKKKIEDILEKIKTETYLDFVELNEEILIDLIENKIRSQNKTKELEDIKSKVPIVLERLKSNNIKLRSNNIVKKVERIIENSSKENNDFIPYYFSKIGNIYKKQELKEKRINSFVEICNNYITNKKLIYLNKETELKMNSSDGEIIDLSDLSSGEKQIISIFSKIYLDENKNFMIIIDEPELSISMKWQQMLLPDILKSEKCSLLLVTTHSPFIFDNELDLYAEDLTSSVIKVR